VSLEKARQFRAVLDGRPWPAGIRRFLIVGTRMETITHFAWNGTEAKKVETTSGGDGTVSIQGAYIHGDQMQFTGWSHVDLIRSDEAADTFRRLLDGDALAGPLAAGQVALSVRDLDVSTGGDVHVKILAKDAVPDLEGTLEWQKGVLPQGKDKIADSDFSPIAPPAPTPIKYAGALLEAIDLQLPAPPKPGIYQIVLREGGEIKARSPSFCVSKS
jgi:phospholipase A1